MDGAEKGEIKMNYVKVSKEQVIEAIKTESLRSGNWIDYQFHPSKQKDVVCHVCAVGAVFRSCLSKKDEEENPYEICDFINSEVEKEKSDLDVFGNCWYSSTEECLLTAKKELKKNKAYLRTLSHVFESLCMMRNAHSRHQIYRIKKILIEFVEENFPKYIKVPVNGFEVKEGLKVIKG